MSAAHPSLWSMRFGFVIPFGDAGDVADLAAAGERAGWDGVFLAEALFGVDAWISLARPPWSPTGSGWAPC